MFITTTLHIQQTTFQLNISTDSSSDTLIHSHIHNPNQLPIDTRIHSPTNIPWPSPLYTVHVHHHSTLLTFLHPSGYIHNFTHQLSFKYTLTNT